MLRSSSRRTFDRFTNLGLPTALPTWLSSQTETRLATFGLPSAATSVVTQVGRAPRRSSVRSRSSSAAERERTSASGTAGPAERAPLRFGGAIAPMAGMSLFTTPVSDIPTFLSRALGPSGPGNSISPPAVEIALMGIPPRHGLDHPATSHAHIRSAFLGKVTRWDRPQAVSRPRTTHVLDVITQRDACPQPPGPVLGTTHKNAKASCSEARRLLRHEAKMVDDLAAVEPPTPNTSISFTSLVTTAPPLRSQPRPWPPSTYRRYRGRCRAGPGATPRHEPRRCSGPVPARTRRL